MLSPLLSSLFVAVALVSSAADRVLSLAVSIVSLLALHARHSVSQARVVRAAKAVAHASRARLHARAKARYARRHPHPIDADIGEHLSLLEHLGGAISDRVGSMWCAFLFLGLSLVSLPAVLATHDLVLLNAWLTQTCFQLVLLPVIMVGGNVKARVDEHRQRKMYGMLQTLVEAQAQAPAHKRKPRQSAVESEQEPA